MATHLAYTNYLHMKQNLKIFLRCKKTYGLIITAAKRTLTRATKQKI